MHLSVDIQPVVFKLSMEMRDEVQKSKSSDSSI